MKDEMSSLDLHFMVRELQGLVGGRFQKAYSLQDQTYLQFHTPGLGKVLVRIKPGLFHITEYKPAFGEPSGFITFLRKRLSGARLKKLEQLGMDRIVIFTFVRGFEDAEEYRLVLELLAPGNVILLGKKPLKDGFSEEIILGLQKPQAYKDRHVRGGIPYQAPPQPINLKENTVEELVEHAMSLDLESLVKTLAIGFSIGGEYAELLCERAGLDKNKTPEKSDVKRCAQELAKLLDEDIRPKKTNKGVELFSKEPNSTSFSEALDSDEDIVISNQPKKKKKSIQEIQAEQRKGLVTAAEENQKKGELIYEHYQELQEILEKVKAGEVPEGVKLNKEEQSISINFK